MSEVLSTTITLAIQMALGEIDHYEAELADLIFQYRLAVVEEEARRLAQNDPSLRLVDRMNIEKEINQVQSKISSLKGRLSSLKTLEQEAANSNRFSEELLARLTVYEEP